MKIKSILVLVIACGLTSSVLAVTKNSSVHPISKRSVISNAPVVPSAMAVSGDGSSYFHAPFVFASPYLSGAKSEYNASDLITNWSSINEDLAILQAQKKHANALEAAGMAYPDRPIIAISGYVEGRALVADDYNTNVKSDINLSGAEFDVLAQMTPWASAYISMAYDNSSPIIGPRFDNSEVYLSRAFLTIGNLDKTPIYGTIGQFYVPFGSFSSDMILDSVTKILGRTEARALELGFYKSGLHAEIFVFRGDTDEDRFSGINNGGADLGYKFIIGDKFTATFGIGYIYNLADSIGMQMTGGAKNGNFVGFGGSSYYSKDNSEDIVHAVAGGDVNAKIIYGGINLIAEYISALESFDSNDLMFNGKGACPSALSVELAYRFDLMNKPAFIAATYGQTREALALNLPKESYVGTFGISLWKSTVQKLEYRHELNYGYGDYASGGNQPGYIYTTSERVRNIGMFQIDVFF
jgi:hypothetical protein